MTTIEVIDRARYLLNEPLDATRSFPDNTSTFYTDTALLHFANIVQEEVQNELIQVYEDFFLTNTFLSVSAGTAEYALPTGTIKIRRVADVGSDGTDSYALYPVTINNRRIGNVSYTSGTINGGGYYLHGTRIVLTETPTFTDSSRIKIDYIPKLADLANSSDVSDIPSEHHGVLVWGVVSYALHQGQSDATKADLEYNKRKMEMKKQAESRQIQRSRRIKNTNGDAVLTRGVF